MALSLPVSAYDRDYSAPISLPTTDTRRHISAIDVLGITLGYATYLSGILYSRFFST